MFVGGEFDIDYEGALKAGLNAFLITRENKFDENIKKIKNLKEILHFI
ncbi:MAG: hypothetical protein QXK18_01650 [Candidatus Bathyarchaeia archaeon]